MRSATGRGRAFRSHETSLYDHRKIFRVEIDPGLRTEFERKFASISMNAVESASGSQGVIPKGMEKFVRQCWVHHARSW